MPLLLTGDANTITRPHDGSGALKAVQDALCLERMLHTSPSVADAAATFNAERNPAGNEVVQLGRRMGRTLVEAAPDWSTMDSETMSQYVTAAASRQNHYLFVHAK